MRSVSVIRALVLLLAVLVVGSALFLGLIFRKRIFVVYQMGKVASSSIVASFKDRDACVIQVHYLSLRGVLGLIGEYAERGWQVPRHVYSSVAVRLLLSFRPRILSFVVPFRSPGVRNISAFFQNVFDRFGSWSAGECFEDERATFSRFCEFYPHWLPDEWLVRDFCTVFNTSPGALRVGLESGAIKVRCGSSVHMGLVDRGVQRVLDTIANVYPEVGTLHVSEVNVGEEKVYSGLYRRVKDSEVFVEYAEFASRVNPQVTALCALLELEGS